MILGRGRSRPRGQFVGLGSAIRQLNQSGHDLRTAGLVWRPASRGSCIDLFEDRTAPGRCAPPYSAASRTYRAVTVRIVTSSSAAVGCSAMVASKSALVAFIFTAMPST